MHPVLANSLLHVFGEDEWEHVRSWSRRVSSPERLRDELEQTHTEITQLREIIDFSRARGRAPPDHYYRDLDILHARYDQLSLALAESREAFASSRRGRSPVVASPGVASPAAAPRPPRPDSSSRMGLRLSPQPGPSSSGDQRTQSSFAPATPQRSQASSSSKRFTPQKKSPDPPRGFSGVGVCPLFVVL